MVYREGLSLPQINVQLKDEIEALKETIVTIGQKINNSKYDPEVMYMTVNKKINTRFFDF